MGIAEGTSVVYLPDTGKPYPLLIDFLATRFPKIPVETWVRRIAAGKVLTEEGRPITPATAYMPDRRLFYYREVAEEPALPFRERIVFHDDHLLVACKPHFLPVTPTGPYVRESLLGRLQAYTGNLALSPINRIDRETAGLVLFSTDKKSRGLYQQMFMEPGKVQKTYEAIAEFAEGSDRREWQVENRIETGAPWFRMKICPGPVNARTRLQLMETDRGRARFRLTPLTGKKHQLRLHLCGLGFTIVNDRLYPHLQEKREDDFSRPLQLLSRRIEFHDPRSGREMAFESSRHLSLFPAEAPHEPQYF
jgi:tRNA pseudouridine32 synthase/23S rRNA pseudouridine746 synthase